MNSPFSEWFKHWYWNIPCFTGWAVSGDYSRFLNDYINQLFRNRIPKYSKMIFWWKRLSDLHNCLPVLVAPDPVHPWIFSRQFLLSSCGQLTISSFDYLVSHLNDDTVETMQWLEGCLLHRFSWWRTGPYADRFGQTLSLCADRARTILPTRLFSRTM